MAGKFITYAPAFTTTKVNPNAFDAGAFVNVIVDVPLNCLLKLFAVDRSNVALPPVPKSEYVSLYVVDATLPVTDNVVPSNNIADST